MEYLAHYDKKKGEKQNLNEHLFSVSKLAQDLIPPAVNFDNIGNFIVKEVCYWMGFFHDLGKYSDYFQEYLQEDKNSRLKNHAHISACFTYSFLSNYLLEFDVDKKTKRILLFFCYLCVRAHHTSLEVSDSLFPYNVWSEPKLLEKHLIKKGKEVLQDLSFENKFTYEEFCKYLNIETLEKNKPYFEYMPIKFCNGRINDPQWYFLLIFLFSVLIDTDKLDSAKIKPKVRDSVSPDNVVNYLMNKHNGEEFTNLDERRERARKSMLKVINSLTNDDVKNKKLFTLTAPTGIGKTLSSLQCALRLQERIQEVEGYVPRLITAIPFINIIEQNKMEYQNVLGGEVRLIVHHRLSDFSAEGNSPVSEWEPVDKALLETEAWEGDVILTTFVQLFQSMFTGRNKLLKKINKLAGSIVILDEAQAVPEKYMPLIGATLKMFSKYYGTRFILMTATQPKLLEFGDMLLSLEGINVIEDKTVELLPNYEEYFKCFHRTKLVPLLDERLDENGFINLFFKKWDERKSGLIVVNTIKRSIELYKAIKKKIKQDNINVPVYYLSTNIVPLHRRKVIKEVGDLLKNRKPVILISTQTIEAGVDMDFDMGFRDFAPLDSLIQTAGRVNRKGEKGKYLPVYIVRLENDNHFIYNLSHRESTLKLLTEKNEIKETEYGDLVNKYYELAINRGVCDDESREIWAEGIVKLDFKVLEKFKLIDNIGEIYDVFIEMDSKATDLADAYEAILNYKDKLDYDLTKIFPSSLVARCGKELDIYERKALLKLIIAKMSDYVVSLRVSRLVNNRSIEFKARGNTESSLFWVPYEQKEQYYDECIGYKDENGEAYIF